MLQLTPFIEEHYSRHLSLIGDNDPYSGTGYLGITDVLQAHYLIADYFYNVGSGLGGIGPKDMDLLHSALYRQHIAYEGKPKWDTKYDICATLFYGLIKNHPFHDANKRTAFLALVYHLETVGLYPTINQKELEGFAVEVAENNLDRHRRYKDIRKKTVDKNDAPVRYISYFIRANTRKIDKRNYIVTYSELNTILKKYGFELQNPRKNYIDVVRIRSGTRPRFLGLWRQAEENVKVAQIGFPSWKSQVTYSAIRLVREKTGLTYENGVDSQVFFKGGDVISILLSQYEGPLRRLAGR